MTEINVYINDEDELRWAACNGRVQRVRELIMNSKVNVHADDDRVLRLAACFGHVECVRELCKSSMFNTSSIIKIICVLMELKQFNMISIVLREAKCA